MGMVVRALRHAMHMAHGHWTQWVLIGSRDLRLSPVWQAVTGSFIGDVKLHAAHQGGWHHCNSMTQQMCIFNIAGCQFDMQRRRAVRVGLCKLHTCYKMLEIPPLKGSVGKGKPQ